MLRGNSDLAQRMLPKKKVSIRHSLDTSLSAQNRTLNPNSGGLYRNRKAAISESNIRGPITLASATGSTPAIKLEV